MRIRHSDLITNWIAFWIETHIDGTLMYQTFLDFERYAWITCSAEDGRTILHEGAFDGDLTKPEQVEVVKQRLAATIRASRI